MSYCFPANPLTICALVTALAGCALIPAVNTPEPRLAVAVPEAWSVRGTEPAGSSSGWISDFDDPQLPKLVQEAVRENYDLRATAARFSAAKARARIAGAPLYPELDAGVEASRRQTRTGNRKSIDNSYGLEAEVSWEADVWGRLGNAARAAEADAEAAEADLLAARLALAGTVARSWFEAIEAEQQVRLAERTVTSFSQTLGIIDERYRSGLGEALDVHLARNDLAVAEGNLALRLRERDQAVRQLELSLGRYPGAELSVAGQLPRIQRPIPAGLPSELLVRRPDLLAAERRLAGAEQRLEEARKNRLPAFRLTARGGNASDTLSQMLDWDNLVWSLIAGITQPIFQGGRLSAEVALASADNREAWADYAQVVLTAFREVETSLAAEALFTRQTEALRRAATESRDAENLARDRYRQGLTDVITLLESQRRAFNSESTLLRTARERLANRINLYLALGGDFDADNKTGTN